MLRDLPTGSTARARVDAFRRERFSQQWGDRNLLAGIAVPGPSSIVVQHNDYLAIGRHPSIIRAQADSLRRVGNGVLMSGTLIADGDDPQLRLEDEFATFMGVPATVLCQSGWEANIGLLQAIAGRDDQVYVDSRAHMSLWEGARTSGATVRGFRHNDPEHLQRRISSHGRGIVLVDSIYSGDGSICPLPEVAAVCDRFDCTLVVDESHSLGTHGPHGSGLVRYLGLGEKVHFVTASLSKAFASRAGLITCHHDFVTYFKLTSFPAVFSSTLLPHDVAGCAAALWVIIDADDRRERLTSIAEKVRAAWSRAGLDIGDTESQIIAVHAGTERQAADLRDEFQRRDVFGAIFIPPATNPNRSVVRISLHAGLADADVDRLVHEGIEAHRVYGTPAGHPACRDRSA